MPSTKKVPSVGSNGKSRIKNALKQSDVPEQVFVPELVKKTIRVQLVGDSPLIVHQMSSKTTKMLLERMIVKGKKQRPEKIPWAEYFDSLHFVDKDREGNIEIKEIKIGEVMPGIKEGDCGFPASGFKKCATASCRYLDNIPMTWARGAFRVLGDIVPVYGSLPKMRCDNVRIGMGSADVRFRGEFWPWNVELKIQYNVEVTNVANILNLLNYGGFHVGVGEWRPGSPKNEGPNGMFHVKMGDE